jgi:hypothetical protein
VNKSFGEFREERLGKKNKSWDGQIKRKIFKFEHKLIAYIWEKENKISSTGGNRSQSNKKAKDAEVKRRKTPFSNDIKTQIIQGYYDKA